MASVLAKVSDSIEEFLIELMKIDSTTGKEWELAEVIKEFMEKDGWEVERQIIEGQENRANLLIKRPNVDKNNIKYLFNTHLDTVPPYTKPRVGDECIYGRGSNDAKGQITSMLFTLRNIQKESPKLAEQLALLLVVGEETDHIGMIEANKFDLKPQYLIVGEPTELTFAHAQKGAVKVQLIARGRAAHSGYPEKGHSAIHELLDVLNDLRNIEWPKKSGLGDTTLNIGLIQGGQAMNALAEHAEATLMFRVVDSAGVIINLVESTVKGRVEIKVLGLNEPVHLSKPPSPYNSVTVCFNTDIPYFDNRHLLKGTFLFGGGSITTAHSKHEFIPIEELKKCPGILKDLIYKLEG